MIKIKLIILNWFFIGINTLLYVNKVNIAFKIIILDIGKENNLIIKNYDIIKDLYLNYG